VPQPYNPQDWDRYRYVRNNPLVYSDPTGHNPLLLIAALVVGTIVLTGDTPLIMPSLPLSNDQAATLGDLLLMGINQSTNANLVGEGLQDLQNYLHIKGAQIDILNDIRNYPNYDQQPFEVPISEPEDFTANGPDGNWWTGAISGNPSFWMVHTANLYVTNAKVYRDGTIVTTWKIEDQFDYLPAWNDRSREGASY
jgi:hypothetical protein